MLANFINEIILAYTVATFIFLVLCLRFKSCREKLNSFLNCSNLIILITLFLNVALELQYSIACNAELWEWLNKLNTTDTAFQYKRNCYTPLLSSIVFGFGFQLVFLFKKHRLKISATIFSILLLTFFENIERIIMVFTSLFRDFLPSSWSTYYETPNKLWTLLLSFIYFAICWIIPGQFNRKKDS
jgi:hypothetical protein